VNRIGAKLKAELERYAQQVTRMGRLVPSVYVNNPNVCEIAFFMHQQLTLVGLLVLYQNRHQKVFSIGGLFICARAWHYKINQNSTYLYGVSRFNLGEAWSFVWEDKPTKSPRGDGTVLYYISNPLLCLKANMLTNTSKLQYFWYSWLSIYSTYHGAWLKAKGIISKFFEHFVILSSTQPTLSYGMHIDCMP